MDNSMIFAEFLCDDDYQMVLNVLQPHFKEIESGQQGDAWIWITDGESKVAIDTFSNMKFEVKSDSSSTLLCARVLEVLAREFKLNIFDDPQLEGHE